MRIDADPRLADRRVTEWLLLEKGRRERERSVEKPAPFISSVITISRQFGAGGHTVAHELVERLGPEWQLWDREIIDAVAQSANVRAEMVEALDERTRSWIERTLGHLSGFPMLEAETYRRHLAQVLLAVAQQGNKILLGRGANFVVPDALNVRLCASSEFRARATSNREKIPYQEAMAQVRQVDRERTAFVRAVFGRDVNDPEGYDLVVRTDSLGYEGAAAAIAAAAEVKLHGRGS